MSSLSKYVVAILCGDIHLSHEPPACRGPDRAEWYATMASYLKQLANLEYRYDAPIIYAGDIFDKWNAPAELINFAIEHLPYGFAIPGQHDLPEHSYAQIQRSAYWTLVRAEKLDNMEVDDPVDCTNSSGVRSIRIHGFPWGHEITPIKNKIKNTIHIAVAHRYVWSNPYNNPAKAATDKHFGKFPIYNYDVIHTGDNHTGFLTSIGPLHTVLFNGGTFIRRKSDELDYKPCVGLLHDDGHVTMHFLDTSNDKFFQTKEAAVETTGLDPELFMRVLKKLADQPIQFRAVVASYFLTPEGHVLQEDAKQIIRECLEKANK